VWPAHLKYKRIAFILLLSLLLAQCLLSASLSANLFKLDASIEIDAIQGNGLDLHKVVISFDSLSKNETSYVVQIGTAVLPEDYGQIKDIVLQCHKGVISKQEIACSNGDLSFNDPLASANQAKVQFHRNRLQNYVNVCLHSQNYCQPAL